MTAGPAGPMGEHRSGGRPVVVVPHGRGSVPILQVAGAVSPVADVVWLVDPDDPEVRGSLRLLRRLGTVVGAGGLGPDQVAAAVAPFRPSGVLPLVDSDLVPLADLAQRLALPFHPPDVARRLSDKLAQRRALAEGGVPVPGFWEVPGPSAPEALAALAGQVRFPAVLKPRSGAASRHTVLVRRPDELTAALDAVRRTGASEPMLVEEYLPGRPTEGSPPFADYVSVETVVDATGHHHLAVTGRLHPVAPFREAGLFIPSALGPDDTEAVLGAASDALEALGVAHGCFHTEVKLTPDGPRIIEVNGRMGGAVPDLLRVTAGFDLPALCVRLAIGEPAGVDGPLPCDRVGYWLDLQPPATATTIRSLGGLADIADLPGVEQVFPRLGPGDPVEAWRGTLTFVLAVLGTSPDHEGVLEANRRLYEVAEVTYDHVNGPSGSGIASGTEAA